jgi:hypothetical protein
MKKLALALAIALMAAATVHAQFWVKKDFQQWSKAECQKMLSDSPWAQSRAVTRGAFREAPALAGGDPEPQVHYQVRLLSALPVRKAIVRQKQFRSFYKDLPAEQRKALDDSEAQWMATAYPHHVVVQLVYEATLPALQRDLDAALEGRPVEQWKQHTFLVTAAGKMAPAQVLRVAPGEFHFVFPREVDGRPVIQPADKSVSVEFQHPAVGLLPADRVAVEFKVKNMLLDGQLVF